MQESFSPCYDMSHKYRGHAVIISNEKFKASSNRDGARQDAEKMKALFKALDFHETTFMNLKADEMMEVIKKASKSAYNPDTDCFVLVLSSHGHEEEVSETSAHVHLPQDAAVYRHAVLGVDGKSVYVDEILDLFDCKSESKNDHESLLTGKPKLFFIQACQSGHLAYRGGALKSYDTGATINVELAQMNLSNMQPSDAGLQNDTFVKVVGDWPSCRANADMRGETDRWFPNKQTVSNTSDKNPTEGETRIDDPNPVPARPVHQTSYDIVALSCPDDCLVMYPTVSGKFAYRNTGIGSYMLHFMCQPKVRDLLLYGHDILQFVTVVNSMMASTDIYYTPTAVEILDPVERKELQQNMPLKMTACIIHRLRKSLKFVPSQEDSLMNKMRTMST